MRKTSSVPTAALKHNRVVATATQMMQSMIENPVPTRAEVLDVDDPNDPGWALPPGLSDAHKHTGRFPVVHLDSDGDFVVAWTSAHPTSGDDVMYRSFNADGTSRHSLAVLEVQRYQAVVVDPAAPGFEGAPVSRPVCRAIS